MKRRTLKFMACAATMALILSVTACGGSDDGADTSNTNVEGTQNTEVVTKSEVVEIAEPEVEEDAEDVADDAEDEAEDVAEDEADGADDEYFETLEEAFAVPEVKAAMDEQLGSMDIEGMEFSYEVTGNDFIVTYKVLDTVIDNPDDFAEQMEPVMEQLDVIFSLVAEMFDEALGKEGATTVVVRFLDSADTLLIEHSYKAE